MTTPDEVAEFPLIVPYRRPFQAAFERLNRAWLEVHALLEPADLAYLQDPQGCILAGGGQVFLALDGDEVVGTCAAIRASPTTIELAKLAVAPAAQRRGLGRRLSARVIRFARDAGATQVVLTSNTALVQAIRLYESLGFRHAPIPADVRYRTADVYMTLHLPPPA
ncbi:MAG: GNAT family N-acetyltransferase [Rhodanobacter sp.]|nr:GNAT family N-acetyltransferase [Rhodanobacter sp.]